MNEEPSNVTMNLFRFNSNNPFPISNPNQNVTMRFENIPQFNIPNQLPQNINQSHTNSNAPTLQPLPVPLPVPLHLPLPVPLPVPLQQTRNDNNNYYGNQDNALPSMLSTTQQSHNDNNNTSMLSTTQQSHNDNNNTSMLSTTQQSHNNITTNNQTLQQEQKIPAHWQAKQNKHTKTPHYFEPLPDKDKTHPKYSWIKTSNGSKKKVTFHWFRCKMINFKTGKICNQTVTSNHITRHIDVCSGNQYKCPQCNKKCNTEHNLKLHIAEIHEKNKQERHYCPMHKLCQSGKDGGGYTRAASMKRHWLNNCPFNVKNRKNNITEKDVERLLKQSEKKRKISTKLFKLQASNKRKKEKKKRNIKKKNKRNKRKRKHDTDDDSVSSSPNINEIEEEKAETESQRSDDDIDVIRTPKQSPHNLTMQHLVHDSSFQMCNLTIQHFVTQSTIEHNTEEWEKTQQREQNNNSNDDDEALVNNRKDDDEALASKRNKKLWANKRNKRNKKLWANKRNEALAKKRKDALVSKRRDALAKKRKDALVSNRRELLAKTNDEETESDVDDDNESNGNDDDDNESNGDVEAFIIDEETESNGNDDDDNESESNSNDDDLDKGDEIYSPNENDEEEEEDIDL